MACMGADSGNLMSIAQQLIQHNQPQPQTQTQTQTQTYLDPFLFSDPFPFPFAPVAFDSTDWVDSLPDYDPIPNPINLPTSLLRTESDPLGGPTQRAAFHLYRTLTSPTLTLTPPDLAIGLRTLHDSLPFPKFAHLTANQAILDAAGDADRIHVVDFGIDHGVQWPPLLQALSTRPAGKPRKITISGIPRPSSVSTSTTGCCLRAFAESLDLNFEFRLVDDMRFEIDGGEFVAVNFMLCLHRETAESLEKILRLAKFLKPGIVTFGEHEISSNEVGFSKLSSDYESEFEMSLNLLGPIQRVSNAHPEIEMSVNRVGLGRRVSNAWALYSAYFEALAVANLDSEERERVERCVLGRWISDAVGTEWVGLETRERWTALMESCGFEAVEFSNYALSQARILLWHYYSRRYGVVESRPGFLSLAWDDRPLLFVSSWK